MGVKKPEFLSLVNENIIIIFYRKAAACCAALGHSFFILREALKYLELFRVKGFASEQLVIQSRH